MGINQDMTIDERGRITIPKIIREKLHLYPGTHVVFNLDNDRLIIQKAISRKQFVEELCGIIEGAEEDFDLKSIWKEDSEE